MIGVRIEVVATNGDALEIIHADRGIEVMRQRLPDGHLEAMAYELNVEKSRTLLLHAVGLSPVVAKPGNLVHGDIEQPKIEPPEVKPFEERMADLEEFYDSASVALHQMHEVLADTSHDDATKLQLIEQILDADIDAPPAPLVAGDYEGYPHLRNIDGAV